MKEFREQTTVATFKNRKKSKRKLRKMSEGKQEIYIANELPYIKTRHSKPPHRIPFRESSTSRFFLKLKKNSIFQK